MEVSTFAIAGISGYPQTPFKTQNFIIGQPSAMDTPMDSTVDVKMDTDIDVDMDMAQDEEIAVLQAQQKRIEAETSFALQISNSTTSDPPTGPRSDTSQADPPKVYISGVDQLSTADIIAFATEHFSSQRPLRVEWIDDTSANIVYDSQEAALTALGSFSSIEIEVQASTERPAKCLSTKPEFSLNVRMATLADRKKPGARERSRYYLLNPDQDPAERRHRNEGRRRRRNGGKQYSNEINVDYRRRRYDSHENQRRRRADETGFDVNLYDDDAGLSFGRNSRRDPASHSERSSIDDTNSLDRPVAHKRKELFPSKIGERVGRLRDRSASPMRDFEEMDRGDDRSTGRKLRDRSYSPPRRSRSRRSESRHPRSPDPRSPRHSENNKKELFPGKAKGNATSAELKRATDVLFNGKTLLSSNHESSFMSNPSGDITQKASTPLHRRSDAFDAADETADLFSSRMIVPFTDGASERASQSRGTGYNTKRATLFSSRLSNEDRTHITSGAAVDEKDFSIRGAAQNKLDHGFSIRGSARLTGAALDRELFPEKLRGNAGKELFAERLEGRGVRRRRAEDMFH
ncbi:MAG: hypothetical protein M1829_006546 [Trizodia sp. TS-e1964]|nr:MAG: hypothetical protein M1829_006546 [Trizodia sp. TS-e1964]